MFLLSLSHRDYSSTSPAGTWYWLTVTALSPSMAPRPSPTSPLLVWESAGTASSTDSLCATPFSSMVGVCWWTLTMRFGPDALGSTFYVCVSTVFEMVARTTCGDLSTSASSILLHNRVLHRRLSLSHLNLFCALLSSLSSFFCMSTTRGGRRSCHNRVHTFAG